MNLVNIRPHPEPKKDENFELSGQIFCKQCNSNWGMMGVYRKVRFPKCNISSFVVVSPNNTRKNYSRWKEVPFHVQPMLPEDLTNIDNDDDE